MDSEELAVDIEATYVVFCRCFFKDYMLCGTCSLLFHCIGLNVSCSCGVRYLFGQEVEGTAYAVFGVICEGQKKSFPASLQTVKVSTRIVTLKCTFSQIHRSNIHCLNISH